MCTNANNWKQTQIGRWIVGTGNYEIFNYPSLTYTAAGQPRVTARVFAQNDDGSDAPDGLYYYGCDAGCDQMRNWQRVLLIPTGSGSYPHPSWDIELDTMNRPRIVIFTGDGLSPDEFNHRLLYLWCDADCFNIDAWSYTAVGTRDDGESPDLELDAQNRPRVAWIADDGSLGYAWCTTACEGDSPQWQTRTIETPATMEQANPQAIPPHCDQAVWQGIAPTLSLDHAGNPRFAYDVQVDARCRYVDPDDPTRPVIRFERVWNGVRWRFQQQP